MNCCISAMNKRFFESCSKMMLLCLGIFLSLNVSGVVYAQVSSAPRQLIVFKPALDGVYGTWVAAVVNQGEKPEKFRIPVLLPADAKDFQALEGIAKEDIKLDGQGVWIEKNFDSGTNIISVAFISGAEFGVVELKFKARVDVGELTIMTPHGMLDIKGLSFSNAGVENQDNQKYTILTSTKMILNNDEFALSINGVPEGRKRLLLIGLTFAGLLLGTVIILAYKSKPIYLNMAQELEQI